MTGLKLRDSRSLLGANGWQKLGPSGSLGGGSRARGAQEATREDAGTTRQSGPPTLLGGAQGSRPTARSAHAECPHALFLRMTL